jgi:uncharacterized protein YukE
MPEIQNNTEGLRTFSNDLRSRNMEIAQNYQNLNNELQMLLDNGWQDAQAEKFSELMSIFFEQFVLRFIQESETIPDQLNNLATEIEESYNQTF